MRSFFIAILLFFIAGVAQAAAIERFKAFAKGTQTLDGRRALVYSRIRENRLDAADNDLTRGGRQQEVVQAITAGIPTKVAGIPATAPELAS